jgi:hypothetical protein
MMRGCMTYWGPGYACQIYDGAMNAEDYQGTVTRKTVQMFDIFL